MKKYRILHITTGNYICVVYHEDLLLKTVIEGWAKESVYNCAFYINRSYVFDCHNKDNITDTFIGIKKETLNKLIRNKDFIGDLMIDLRKEYNMEDFDVLLKEFEIVEVA